MISQVSHENRAIVHRMIIRLVAIALLFLCISISATPFFRLGLEGNFANQNFRDVANTEFNGAVFAELSRDYKCPYRLSTGVRAASFTYGDLGYLIVAPEINAKYFLSLSKRMGLLAEAGAGYFLSNAAEVESGAYGRIAAGAIFQPLPVLDLRITVSSIPFKTPSNESFMNIGAGVGVTYMFGFPDKDKDWVADDVDTCNGTPAGARVNEYGCALDTDGDGVFDGLDKCPETPFEALVDADGCPIDSDNDGIFDGVDKCDDTPEDIKVDSTGCPKDSDQDGIADYVDTCDATPKNAIVDEYGCPRDSDEDGVYDGIDQCPQTPSGFVVNEIGCPFVMPVEREIITDAYDAGLNLLSQTMQKLENIAERLRAYPYRKVEIGVYTDSEGSNTYNINRGYRVAEKVKDVLLARGVSEDQLVLKGYGEVDPIASNATLAGKKTNRRIVFRYLPEE